MCNTYIYESIRVPSHTQLTPAAGGTEKNPSLRLECPTHRGELLAELLKYAIMGVNDLVAGAAARRFDAYIDAYLVANADGMSQWDSVQ